MPSEAIKLENIGLTYSSKTGEIEALKDIDFSVNNNEFVTILGPSGCGKTTLLKLISGLIKETQGKISINGEIVSKAVKENKFGFVFQKPTLLEWRTILENVQLPNEIIQRKKPNNSLIQKYEELLKIVGLHDFGNNLPKELSLGMQQRVAIARALSLNPKILLMDEPFSSLDELKRDELDIELLKIWGKIKNTVVFVTHNVSEAIFLADRVIVLSKRPGKIKEIIKINFSRPRTLDLKDTKEFIKIKKYVRALIDNGK